jgi:hypothetical protein
LTNECVAAHRCAAERNDPASLFHATEVHLGSPAEVDLLVIGVCPMCGADNDWFWLVRSLPRVRARGRGKSSGEIGASRTEGGRVRLVSSNSPIGISRPFGRRWLICTSRVGADSLPVPRDQPSHSI